MEFFSWRSSLESGLGPFSIRVNVSCWTRLIVYFFVLKQEMIDIPQANKFYLFPEFILMVFIIWIQKPLLKSFINIIMIKLYILTYLFRYNLKLKLKKAFLYHPFQTNLTSSFVITALKVSENVSYIMPSNSTTSIVLTRTPTLSYGFLWYQICLCFSCSFLQWICPNKSFLVEWLSAELDKSTVGCPMYSCVVERILKT